jgi:hypothetical protein
MPETWQDITDEEAAALLKANPHWEHYFSGISDQRTYNDFTAGQVFPESIRLRRHEGYGEIGPWRVRKDGPDA